MKMVDYKDSGVDLEFAQKIPAIVKGLLKQQGVSGGSNIGGFGAAIKLAEDMYVSMACDGVGTKLILAQKLGKYDTVGIDLVAMNVNDILCTGLYPKYFLDYMGFGDMEEDRFKQILSGIIQGCKESGSQLIGGESAQMTEVYGDKIDLVGFSMGMGRKKDLLNRSKVKEGDRIVGLPSSGLHSNGFSLVNLLIEKGDFPLGDELLIPTKIYVKEFKRLRKRFQIKAAAHITGGGVHENLLRAVPPSRGIKLHYNWKVPEIFKRIQACGVDKNEMYRVFNMGIGFAFILSGGESTTLPEEYKIIGEVI